MSSVVTGRPEPASWLAAPRASAETSTLGPGASPRSLFTWCQAPARHRGGHEKYPMAEADRGRHPDFPRFNVLAGGPGSLASSLCDGILLQIRGRRGGLRR